MSDRLTLSDLKAESSRIASALNICPDDDRFLAWLNEAEERLSNQGRWLGSVQEVQFSTDSSGCFAWPREVATIERLAVDGNNIDVANGWMPFTRQIARIPNCGCSSDCCTSGCTSSCYSCGHLRCIQKEGTMASFATTYGANKKIRTRPVNPGDVGKSITYEGYSSTGVWTSETVVMAFPYADTLATWQDGSPLGVKKAVTLGNVKAFEYDTVAGTERQLADYQPGETRPSYRIGWIPRIGQLPGCCVDSVRRHTLTAMVSLKHVPLVSDGDWLLFQNLAAYKAAMIAVKAWEEGDAAKADYYFYGSSGPSRNARGVTRVVNRGGAIPLLNAELRKMSSDRTNVSIIVDETNRLTREMIGFR